ncbi:hypothetical protein [Herpetosiphon geysericola]|uniref:PH domain-containing protein n=1 Tax=Herpetosiphon geysericola TaxID=70996 RepID=A0A0P6XMT6_9CHLR|nr:hypothetical protein [Herpetosiphon geysericola]KPL81165.1 hypothetical protein SE18_20920 [Herpetosiphon geysericola]
MQSASLKYRLRPPYQRIQIGLVITSLILYILMITTIRWQFDWTSLWKLIIIPIGTMPFAMNAISYLDLSASGLVMRRGWQYFAINWEQVEAFGIGVVGKRIHMPYIVLYEPIKGLPSIKIKELTPEQQQRTLTLEGWVNSKLIAKALHVCVNIENHKWQVIPNFSKTHPRFYSYQKFNLCYFFIVVSIFIYLGAKYGS